MSVFAAALLAACGDDGANRLDKLQVTDVDLTTVEDTPLSVQIPVTSEPNVTLTVNVIAQPAHGAVQQDATDPTTYVYTPAADFNGQDTFEVKVSDGSSEASGSVRVTVSPVNDAPTPGSDSFAAAVNTPLTVALTTLLANDTDVDTDHSALSITGVDTPLQGTVAIVGDKVVFTPVARYQGPAGYNYTLTDGAATSTGTVSISVGADNAPIAGDDTLTTAEDKSITVSEFQLLANDSDVDQQTLAVTDVANAVNGTVTRDAVNQKITFTPDANFNGIATFDYIITDGAATDTGTVTVTVTAVPDAPVAGADAITTAEDTPLVVDTGVLLVNDSDADADAISITSVTKPTHGTATLVDTTLTYTPDPDFNGTDTFNYTLTDHGGLTGNGIVTITVTAVNDAPVAVADSRTTNEDTTLTVSAASLLVNDSDVDHDALTLTSVQNPTNGTVSLTAGVITFAPNANFHGTASFDYTITDGALTATATVTVNVLSVNDVPVAVNDVLVTAEDTLGQVDLLANDTDADLDALTVQAFTAPAHGTLAIVGGVASYNPAPNFNGTDAFTYTIADGQGGTATASVAITVTPVNDTPIAKDDALTTNEDTAGSLNVLANDTDPDGDTLTVTAHTNPANGALAIAANGAATYTPAANFNGTDAFTYTVSDGHGGTATATVQILVASVNDNPVAGNDTIATSEDTAGSVDVLVNDSDVDGDPLGVAALTQPSHGTVSFSGSIATYTPNANFNGSDSFTYKVTDGAGGSAVGTVNITVTAVNDNPTTVTDNLTTAEDTAKAINVLTNDSDVDGDTLTVTAHTDPAHGTVVFAGAVATYTPAANFNGADSFTYTASDGHGGTAVGQVLVTVTPVNDAPSAVNDTLTTAEDTAKALDLLANDNDVDGDTLTITAHTNPAHGTVTFVGGVVTYTPAANFNGSDTFQYTVSDGTATANATVAITVTAVNDPPVAVDDAITTNEDTAGTVSVLTNDSDVEGDTLTVTGHSNPAHGTVVVPTNGNVTYTPAANFHGVDSFTYTVSDGHGGTDNGTVNITVLSVNDPPVAKADALTTAEDTAGTVNVLANDTDADGDVLSVSANTAPAHGTVTFVGGVATYTPVANFHGADSFKYTADDGNGGTSQGTVTVTVTSVNDPPVATNDTITTNEDTAASLNLLANDSDVDGDALTILSHTNAAHGTLAFSAGTVTYTPAANFNGTDTFDYTVSDGHGGTDNATVAITVISVDDPPVAIADVATVNEDTLLNAGSVLVNDSDVDDTVLTAQLVAGPTHSSSFTLNADGTYSYQGAQDFNGTDQFTYKAKDPSGALSNTVAVVITVVAVNDAPVAVNDTFLVNEDTNLASANVLTNDTDPDTGDTKTATVVSPPTHSSAFSLATNGAVTYKGAQDFNGTDTFTYKVTDTAGAVSNTATVTITVKPVNDAPVAVADAFTVAEDTALAGANVLTNDSDVDLDALTAQIVAPPAHASTFTLAANGAVTYTATQDFNGTDTFTYRVSDGALTSGTVTATITVTAVQDPPVAVADTLTTNEDTAKTVAASVLTANDSDPDGDTVTLTAVTNGVHGTAALAGGNVTYTPNANFNGSDSFTYTLSDGHGNTATGTVNVTVNPVNDAPVAVADSATTNEDTAKNINVLVNDSDVDGDTLTPVIVTGPAHGTTSVNADKTVKYTPNANFNGSDSFTYKASDGTLTSGTVAVAITVTAVNDRPTVVDIADVTTTPETAVDIDLAAGAADVDGDTLTFAVVAAPTNGDVVVDADTGLATYTPDPGFSGTDTFTYVANDGTIDSVAKLVTITVGSTVAFVTPDEAEGSFVLDNTVGATNGSGDLDATLEIATDAPEGSVTKLLTGADAAHLTQVGTGTVHAGRSTFNVTFANGETGVMQAQVEGGESVVHDYVVVADAATGSLSFINDECTSGQSARLDVDFTVDATGFADGTTVTFIVDGDTGHPFSGSVESALAGFSFTFANGSHTITVTEPISGTEADCSVSVDNS